MELYSEFLSPDLLPTFDYKIQVFFRIVTSCLFLLFFVLNVPILKLYFRGKSYGGYHDEVGLQKYLSPFVANSLLSCWILCIIAILFDQFVVLASLVNLCLAYYFFIRLRWRSLARGMGAPGFMFFWLAACVFLLELTTRYANSARPWIILMFQIDFAIIMLSAGIYKVTSGYLQNNGMELGMLNPQWGYWPSFFKSLSPKNPIFYFLNQAAWLNEIVGAVLMLIPQTRLIGGFIIAISFLFVGTQIRLGNLVYMVMAGTIVFIHEGSFVSTAVSALIPTVSLPSLIDFSPLAALISTLGILYIILRPISLAGLYYNFYLQKKLPNFVQWSLDRYTNLFGIIMWRVFTIDIVNFFVDIYLVKDGKKTKISHYDRMGDWRFNQVCESITVTTIFTALKYFPGNLVIFKDRILSYVKTLPPHDAVVFEYFKLVKGDNYFEFRKVAEYFVQSDHLTETLIDSRFDPRMSDSQSASHACQSPGSYSPAKS